MVLERQKMKNITIGLTENFVNNLEKLQAKGLIPSRSEGIRLAIRLFLKKLIMIRRVLGYDESKENPMEIITCNLPESYLKVIDSMCGDHGLFHSRSELFRISILDFLTSELDAAENFIQPHFNSTVGIPSKRQESDDAEAKLEHEIQEQFPDLEKENDPVLKAANISLPIPHISNSKHETVVIGDKTYNLGRK